jgi:hypothetical protein
MATVDIWVDPMCPWTWLTAQWLLEVERVRDVTVTFHVMSLSVLNEGRDDAATWAAGWGPVRLLTAATMSQGEPALRRLYVALATLIHNEGHQNFDRDLYALALNRARLPHSLANAADWVFYDDAMRRSHQAGTDPLGDVLGCPIIHVGLASGEVAAFFGPVVTPRPRDEAAGRLWDSVALAADTDSFFELRRARTRVPVFD